MTFSKLVFVVCGGLLFSLWLLLAFYIFSVANTKINDLDCADFKSQGLAQKEFDLHQTDIYGLDNNKNGIACELLPR